MINRLGDILSETATPCCAWALLSNHAPLLLRTGRVPISTVMRRLLTGYAVTYKSILCQEDPYLLERVCYIHLDPLRAGMVEDLKALDAYQYEGHSVLMGGGKKVSEDVEGALPSLPGDLV